MLPGLKRRRPALESFWDQLDVVGVKDIQRGPVSRQRVGRKTAENIGIGGIEKHIQDRYLLYLDSVGRQNRKHVDESPSFGMNFWSYGFQPIERIDSVVEHVKS